MQFVNQSRVYFVCLKICLEGILNYQNKLVFTSQAFSYYFKLQSMKLTAEMKLFCILFPNWQCNTAMQYTLIQPQLPPDPASILILGYYLKGIAKTSLFHHHTHLQNSYIHYIPTCCIHSVEDYPIHKTRHLSLPQFRHEVFIYLPRDETVSRWWERGKAFFGRSM